MRWKGRRGSSNVIDKRGMPAGGVVLGGGSLVFIIIALLLGVDPGAVLEQTQQTAPAQQGQSEYVPDAREREQEQFASVVLADTEEVWNGLFAEMGHDYVEPSLVLFSGQVSSACGFASSAVGPFYCPGDSNIYLDLGFMDELSQRFGATGDFAQAYVIAHEVAHHVQHQLGYMEQVDAARGRVSQTEQNELTMRLELQADFLAGVWAHHARRQLQTLEPGDVEEAMRAAAAIGDDKLQMQQQGYVVPDSFTHGTSEQRMRWFMRGYESGDIRQGDTFGAREL